MHLFLQICGVIGFSLLGNTLIDIQVIRARGGENVHLESVAFFAMASFALISAYFIFG